MALPQGVDHQLGLIPQCLFAQPSLCPRALLFPLGWAPLSHLAHTLLAPALARRRRLTRSSCGSRHSPPFFSRHLLSWLVLVVGIFLGMQILQPLSFNDVGLSKLLAKKFPPAPELLGDFCIMFVRRHLYNLAALQL